MSSNFDSLPDDAKRAAFAKMKPGTGKRPSRDDSEIDAKMKRVIKRYANKGNPLHEGEIRAIRQEFQRQERLKGLQKAQEAIMRDLLRATAASERRKVLRGDGPVLPQDIIQRTNALADAITRILLKIKPNLSISVEDESHTSHSRPGLRGSRPGHMYGKAFRDPIPPEGTPGFWEGAHPVEDSTSTSSDADRTHPFYGRYFVETAPPPVKEGWEIPLGYGKKIVVKNPKIELGTDIDLQGAIDWILGQMKILDKGKSR